MFQKTLKADLQIEGVGLHSGEASVIQIKPAEADSGIVFERDGQKIGALYSHVSDTLNCTALAQNGVNISTIEHLMAALYAADIDNALITCSALELPIMDGAAEIFYKKLKAIGTQTQNAPRRFLKVLKPVVFEDGKGAKAELLPAKTNALFVHFEIDFPSAVVGHQVFEGNPLDVFESQIAPCRTFCEKQQIDYLRSLGLIKGGNLDNAVVLDGDSILNPNGFKVPNECVNHKVLDALGDMFTSGFRLIADFKGFKTGHYHNNQLLKKLFENQNNYEIWIG